MTVEILTVTWENPILGPETSPQETTKTRRGHLVEPLCHHLKLHLSEHLCICGFLIFVFIGSVCSVRAVLWILLCRILAGAQVEWAGTQVE
jgi:hypothetical protein